MASQDERISACEINNKFIVTNMYGTAGFPSATVVLSTVTIYDKETSRVNDRWKRIYENCPKKRHAELHLCEDLRRKLGSEIGNVTRVEVQLIQNFSPCGDCTDEILKFKNEYNNESIKISIQFANFYLHDRPKNRKGLIKLKENGVDLTLLEGEESWKTFLMDKTFFKLENDEIEKLRSKATSTARRRREIEDRKILSDIEAEAKADVNTEERSGSESGSGEKPQFE